MAKPINGGNYYQTYAWMSKELTVFRKGKDNNVRRVKLSGVTKDLYAIIYHFYRQGKDCYYSYPQLEELTGASKSTVIRELKTLEQSGLIRIEKELNSTNTAINRTFYRIEEEMLVDIPEVPKPCEENYDGEFPEDIDRIF